MFTFLETEKTDLSNGVIHLLCTEKRDADEDKDDVPAYDFDIILHETNQIVGRCTLRIGYNRKIYYDGHIGYIIEPNFRNRGYATMACMLLTQVADAHELDALTITTDPKNEASGRAAVSAGFALQEVVVVPEEHEYLKQGITHLNRYLKVLNY